MVDGSNFRSGEFLLLFDLIENLRIGGESKETSSLSQVVFLIKRVHIWIEHHHSVDESVESEIISVWVNHVHDVVA